MKAFSSFPSVPVALALRHLLLLPTMDAHAQLLTNVHVEALQDSLAPGATNPGTGTPLRWTQVGLPTIADDGEIMFRGFLNNTTGLQQIGIWRGSGGSYTLLVRSADAAPGAGTGVVFDEPFIPPRRAALAPKAIGFRAQLLKPDSSLVDSLWSFASGALTKIAIEGEAEPGGQTYLDLGGDHFFGADDGSVAFGGMAGASGAVFGPAAIWLWARAPAGGGTVNLVAKGGGPAPGVRAATWNALSLAAVSGGANPTIYFFGAVDYTNPSESDGGLFSAPFGQSPAAYVLYSDESATGVSGALFNSFQAFDVNGVGGIAFKAQLRPKDPFAVPLPVDDTNDQAIYLNRVMILRTGTPDPSSGFTFTAFDDLVINNAGQFAFVADLSGGTSICRRDPDGTVAIIASIGQKAPGAPFDATFTTFESIIEGRLEMNNLGQVLFLAHTSDGGSGLWCNDPDGTLQLVVRDDAEIEVAENDVRTIKNFGIVYHNTNNLGTGGHDGRAKYINDSGQIVFQVTFTDNKNAIIATGPATPPTKTVQQTSAANLISSTDEADPINTFTGELFALEKSDLNLGGPMPLFFARYYASKIASDGNISSALGRNRLHNFDAKLSFPNATSATVVLSDGRVAQLTKTDDKWNLAGRTDIAFQFGASGNDFLFADPRSQRIWTFNMDGKLTKIEDGRGNAHTLHYDDAVNPIRPTSVTDDLGRTLAFTYDASGHLANVRDSAADAPNPAVREVNFTYSGDNLVTAADALGHTTTYTYDTMGQLLSTQLPRGNTPRSQTYVSNRVATQSGQPAVGVMQTTSLSYDTAMHKTTITDSVASRVHTYTETGELMELKDEAGKSITFTSDATGRRSTVTDQLGRTVEIAYHTPSGKPASITNAEGATATFTYKTRVLKGVTFYDLVKVVRADGTVRTFTYDANGNRLTATDPLGNKTVFTYNARGQLTTRTNPTGGVATFTYDETSPVKGTLKTSKDSDTAETTYTHDAFSRLTKLTHPDGRHIDIEYDDADNITAITDERGEKFGFAYDANDNATVVTDPATKTTQFDYDALDRVTQVTDRLSRITSRTFDSRDLLASETDALNHTITLAHDARQRLSSVAEPGGATVSFGYDEVGRPVSITDPLTHTRTTVRNKLGRVIAATDSLGYTVQLERDKQQRITKVIDPLGRQTALTYDKRGLLAAAARDGMGAGAYTRDVAGRLVKITDPNHGAWSFAYTPAGRLKLGKDPLGRTTGFTYDSSTGRLASVALPEGGTCALERDESGRVRRASFSGGVGPELHYGYDALGRLSSATGVALARDAEGQITNSAQAGADFSASYDAAGRLATVGYAGALTVTYTYDLNDRLIGVADSLSGANIALAYDAAGRLAGLTRSNGVNTTLTYDAADRLARIQDGTILDLQYTLDAAGDITAANFVTAPLLPAVTAEAKQFQYDAASQVKATGFTYDARGRLTTMPGHAFAWDGASRLITLDATTANAVTLGYDGFGDVTTRTTGGATTRLFYHHAIALHPLVAERAESNSEFTRFYIWTPGGRLLYAVDAATHAPIFYHSDRVGSTLALTNASGTVTDSYAYTPYGEPLGHGGKPGTSTQPFTFVGAFGIRAEGPLYQMRARYYDPLTARFLSRDPAGPRLGDPRTLDPYLYALGNPTRYVDLDGAQEEEYYAPSASNDKSQARTSSFETFFVGFFVSPLISVSGYDIFFGAEEYLDTKVEMPTLLTGEEAFNAELNEARRKSRELEEFINHIEAKAAVSIASAPSLEDSPDDDALIDAELGIAPSKPDQMIEDAIEETGDGDPAIAEAIPVGMNRGEAEPSGPLQIFIAAKNQLLIEKFGSLKAAKDAAKAAKKKKKKQNEDNKKNKEAEKNKYMANPYTTDPDDGLDLSKPKK